MSRKRKQANLFLGDSEDIIIPNLVSEPSILVDYDPMPPNAMTTAAVHVGDVIVRQEAEQNVGGLADEEVQQQEPLVDDDDPERELNLTDEDFSLHVGLHFLFFYFFKN